MSEVIVIANQKGGVGKTTTAINLSYALADKGVRTVLVDLDPQANATSGLGLEKLEGGSLYGPLCGEGTALEKVQPVGANENLFMIPSEVDMAAIEIELIQRVAPGAALHYNNPVRSRAEIARAVELGVRSYSVDSRSELAKLADAPFVTQLLVLSGIALLMTVGVYGFVAGIVKLDDGGLLLSRAAGDTAFTLAARLVIAWGIFVPGAWISVRLLGGGDLVAVSTLGVGSTFTLSLPLRWSEPGEA